MTAAVRAQAGPALPDVVGIRPGMSAQEAYNILKARSNGAKIGIGQMMIQAVSERPVAVIMSVRPMGASPGEVITVWLTVPPGRQVVFGVKRTLNFEQGHEMLMSAVMNELRQKYGEETQAGPAQDFWRFSEQGGLARPSEELRKSGCATAGAMSLSQPDDPTAPQPITPIFALNPATSQCSPAISVWAQFGNASSGQEGLVGWVTVMLADEPLARRSHDAYEALMANADAAKRQAALDKAKQQKKPAF